MLTVGVVEVVADALVAPTAADPATRAAPIAVAASAVLSLDKMSSFERFVPITDIAPLRAGITASARLYGVFRDLCLFMCIGCIMR